MNNEQVPADFAAALASLKATRLPSYIELTEIPGPRRLAPYSVAITAAIDGTAVGESEGELVKGSFIVLYDPEGQVGWDGVFRVVIMIRSLLEADIAREDLIGEVAWSWLLESLEDLDLSHLSGAVSKVTSQPFGETTELEAEAYVELRASWSPHSPDVGAHMHAWGHALATVAGLPPLPEGVTQLGRVR